ncbi:toxin-antitoxin system YwqK family antitoxin [Bacteroidota bacterium]
MMIQIATDLKRILLLFVLLPMSLSSQQLYYSPILIFKNDTAYMRDSDLSYTGLYEVFYDYDYYHGRYLKVRGFFRDGLRDGQFISYYKNKKLESQEYYIDGVIHGEAYYRHMNGYMKKKIVYNNGMLNGKPAFVDWYTNGQPKEAGYYHNDILDTTIYYEKDSYNILFGIIPKESDSIISRDLFTRPDTIRPCLIGLIPQKKPGSQREYFSSIDTILVTEYEIISIIIKANDTTLISKSDIFTNEMKTWLSDSKTEWFKMIIWLRNKDGILWNLPGRKIYLSGITNSKN